MNQETKSKFGLYIYKYKLAEMKNGLNSQMFQIVWLQLMSNTNEKNLKQKNETYVIVYENYI